MNILWFGLIWIGASFIAIIAKLLLDFCIDTSMRLVPTVRIFLQKIFKTDNEINNNPK